MNEKKIEDLTCRIGRKVTLSEGILDSGFLNDITKAEHIIRVLAERIDVLPDDVKAEIADILEK